MTLVIGITGGVASGKSTVARLFGELGACVIDADALAHQALQTDQVRDEVRRRWGDGVFDAGGAVDRRALSRIVFADPVELSALESLIHPRVRELVARALEQCRQAGRAAVLDIPLLLESGRYAEQCDCLVHVEAGPEARARRAAERGWDAAELARREGRQLALAEKARRAHRTVAGDATLAETRAQVEAIWQELQEKQRV